MIHGAALAHVSGAGEDVELVELIDGRSDVVVDLQGISFVDSAGVACLVGIFKSAHMRGRIVRFVGITPDVAAVLRVVKLDEIFEIHPDVESAIRAIRRSVLGKSSR